MSTAVACLEAGRNYLMIEREPQHFSTGEKRIEAVLANLL
jgi:DNA modification methylase